MNKKIVLLSLCLSALSINSYSSEQSIDDFMREKMQKEGFDPNGGVTIVPTAKLSAPKSLKNEWNVRRQEQKIKGYQSIYSDRAKELLQMGDVVHLTYKASAKNNDPNSSLLRKHMSEINMAYKFTPVPLSDTSKLYGFAACNTFNNGWTGVVEFFQNKEAENCAYTENNVTLTHAAVKVDEEVVLYDINNKVTTVNVEGNKDSGYVYTIDWMDSHFFRTLECASKRYSSDITASVIALARRIDSQ